MKEIKFIYFDVGNVLLRFEHMWDQVIQIIGELSPEALQIKDDLVVQLMKGKISYMDYWDRLGKGTEVKKHFSQYEEYLVSGFIPIEETHQLLKQLSRQYCVGLLTDVAHGIHELNVKKGKVPDLQYNAVIESCKVGFKKPEKEIFEIAQSAARCKPHEILFVDDVETHVEKAKELGWNAVQFDPNDVRGSMQNIRAMLSV